MTDKKTTTKEQDLSTFNWDEAHNEAFKDVLTEEEQEQEKEQQGQEQEQEQEKNKKTENKTKDKKEDKKEEKKEEPEGVFSDIDGEDESKEEEATGHVYLDLAKDLKDAGLFSNVEIPEDVNAEKFVELQEAEVDARVKETINGFMNGLDSDAAAFLEYKLHGGDTKEFFNLMSKSKTTSIDEFNENTAEVYLRSVYEQDDTIDDIEDKIAYLKEKEKLITTAEKINEKEKALLAKQKTEEIEQAKKEKIKRTKELEQMKAEVKDYFTKNDKIKGIELSADARENIIKAITRQNIKVGDNQYITAAQAYVNKLWQDKDALGIFITWASNNFDTKLFEKQAETKITKKTANTLRRTASTHKPKVSTSSGSKPLWEYFDN